MSNVQQQVHLIVESLLGSASSLWARPPVAVLGAGHSAGSKIRPSGQRFVAGIAAARAGVAPVPPRPPAMPVPPGPAWLIARAGAPPRFRRRRPAGAGAGALVEPVLQRRQPRLLLAGDGGRPVRVNGLPAPRFVVLKERDCLQLEENFVFHVTIFNTPSIGQVGAQRVGKECPVCRVPFAAAARGYACACGAVMHCEEGGTEDSLQCAQLRARSGCPACQRPVVLEAGYTFLPEVSNV